MKVGRTDTHREKTGNAREYHSRWWVCLESRCHCATLNDDPDAMLTRLTASPIVDENMYRTFMVGLTHVVSPLRDWSNSGTCSRSTSMTESGELQDASLRRSGSDGRSFPVFFL